MSDPGLSVLVSFSKRLRLLLPATLKQTDTSSSFFGFSFGNETPQTPANGADGLEIRGRGNHGLILNGVLGNSIQGGADGNVVQTVNDSLPLFLALLAVLSGADRKRKKPSTASPNTAAPSDSDAPADDKIAILCGAYKLCDSEGVLLPSTFSPSSSSYSSPSAPSSSKVPAFSLVKSLCLTIDTASKLLAHGSLDGRFVLDEVRKERDVSVLFIYRRISHSA